MLKTHSGLKTIILGLNLSLENKQLLVVLRPAGTI